MDRFIGAMTLLLSLVLVGWTAALATPSQAGPGDGTAPDRIVRSQPPVADAAAQPAPRGLVDAAERRARRVAVPFDARRLEAEVLRSANAARARTGAGPLRATVSMNRAAQRYSRELARRRTIDHVSPTRGLRTFRQRIEATGTVARLAGENLAMITATPVEVGPRTVGAWLRSPGHKRNLLDRRFTRSGVGVTLGADGLWYIVQVYATDS